jgi:hypothetical protein
MNKGDKIYFARILPRVGIYDVCDLKVRMVAETWFSAIDNRTKQTFLFSNKEIGKKVFHDRNEALEKVKIAEKNKKEISVETYYEEF